MHIRFENDKFCVRKHDALLWIEHFWKLAELYRHSAIPDMARIYEASREKIINGLADDWKHEGKQQGRLLIEITYRKIDDRTMEVGMGTAWLLDEAA